MNSYTQNRRARVANRETKKQGGASCHNKEYIVRTTFIVSSSDPVYTLHLSPLQCFFCCVLGAHVRCSSPFLSPSFPPTNLLCHIKRGIVLFERVSLGVWKTPFLTKLCNDFRQGLGLNEGGEWEWGIIRGDEWKERAVRCRLFYSLSHTFWSKYMHRHTHTHTYTQTHTHTHTLSLSLSLYIYICSFTCIYVPLHVYIISSLHSILVIM